MQPSGLFIRHAKTNSRDLVEGWACTILDFLILLCLLSKLGALLKVHRHYGFIFYLVFIAPGSLSDRLLMSRMLPTHGKVCRIAKILFRSMLSGIWVMLRP